MPQQRAAAARVSGADRGWLVGPTWLYVTAAALIFGAAVIVAIVQVTTSGDASAAAAAQSAPPPQQAATVSVTTEDESDAAPQAGESSGASAQLSQLAQSAQQQAGASPESEPTQPGDAPQASSPIENAQDQSSAAPAANAPGDPLLGFIVPIADACVSEHEGHLPNALRSYRQDGIHEGLDFYEWASCTTIDYATEVLAAKAGIVIRADVDYVDVTPTDWARFENDWDAPGVLDELRGRQVWIDHGRGVITRYAHLSAIAQGVDRGTLVTPGQVVGYVGESGQREVYANPSADLHLHFEIRVGEGWLGQGEAPHAARLRYLAAFGITED